MKEYHVIFKGGLKVTVSALDVLEAGHQALTNLSKSPDEIISISEILHYFKSRSSTVEQGTHNSAVLGSNPSETTNSEED